MLQSEAARVCKREATRRKVEGPKSHAELHPEVVALAKELHRKPRGGRRPSLRNISAELARRGHVNMHGMPYAAKSVAGMVASKPAHLVMTP